MEYLVVFEQTTTGFSAYAPDLLGCISTGGTLVETRNNMAEAIAFHVEGLQRHGYEVPEPSAVAER